MDIGNASLYTVEISDRSSGLFRTGLCKLSKSQTGLHWSSEVFRTGLCTLSKSQTGLHWSSGVFRTGLCTLSKSRTGLQWSSEVFRTCHCTLSKSQTGLVGVFRTCVVKYAFSEWSGETFRRHSERVQYLSMSVLTGWSGGTFRTCICT